MTNFIVKQVSPVNADPIDSEADDALMVYDFCRSKEWGTTDPWLLNKRENGWSANETNGNYTKFKLELIK